MIIILKGVKGGKNRTPAFKQIGNAVPPLMIEKIAESLLNFWSNVKTSNHCIPLELILNKEKGRVMKTKTPRTETANIADNFEECPPRADAIIHSLRAFGYDLGMAIADLIDNSIFADANNIWVEYAWNEGNPWIRILDDGTGMTEERLVEAMRLGTKSPLEERDSKDLGRFGLGLKTASFSQCKLLTVITKTSEGKTSARFWDIDHVRNSRNWLLGKGSAK